MLAPTYFKDETMGIKAIFRAYLPLHSLSCSYWICRNNFRGEAILPRRNKRTDATGVWQGVTYEPWPIKASGFDKTARERCHVQKFRYRTLPEPSRGSSGKRRSCWLPHYSQDDAARFLDAVNFKDGNPTADPNHISRMKCGLSNRKRSKLIRL